MNCPFCNAEHDVEHIPKLLARDETMPGLGSFYICGNCGMFSVRALGYGDSPKLVAPEASDWRPIRFQHRRFMVGVLLPKIIARKMTAWRK